MAALQSTTIPYRHIVGDLAARFLTLSGNNGDTVTVTGVSDILDVIITPTTDIAVGATWSGNTITFATVGAWTATVMVISRVG